MKNIIKYILVGMMVLITSCDKELVYLDSPIDLTSGSFWKSESDAIAGTSAIYQALITDGTYMRKYMWLMDGRADDCENVTPIDYLMTKTTKYLKSDGEEELISPWQCHYAGVWRANQVLDKVPGIEMDAALKARCLGEAHTLRGLMYFNLLNLFQNIVVYDKNITDIKQYYAAQTNPADAWELVYSDFKAGIDGCWTKDQYKANDNISGSQKTMGRCSKGMAAAYLAKAYLMNGRFSDAAPVLKDIIDGKYGTYSLVNFRDNFTADNEFNDESIFEINYSDSINTGTQGWGMEPGADWQKMDGYSKGLCPKPIGWGDITPSQWIWDEFQLEKDKDGNPDPRIEQTFLFPHYTDATNTTFDPSYLLYGKSQTDATTGWDKLSWSITMTGLGYTNPDFKMIIRKCLVEDITLNGSWKNWINRRVVRYADVLLLYAECENELGNTAEAAKYVQLVRNRSNMPDREAEFAGMTKDVLRDQIIHERSIEFACEWWRYVDLLRWGWFKDPAKVALLKSHDPEFKDYIEGREYMAIPKDEINRNPNLKQNAAWN